MGTGYTQSLLKVAVCSYFSLLMVACSLSNFYFSSAKDLSSSERDFFSRVWLFLEGDEGALMKTSSLSVFAKFAMFITGFTQLLTASINLFATSMGLEYALMASSELLGASTTEMSPLTSISVLLPVMISICSLSTCRMQERSGYLIGEGTEGCQDQAALLSSFSTLFTSFFYSFSYLLAYFSSRLASFTSFTSRFSSFFSSFSNTALRLILACSGTDVSSLRKEVEEVRADLAESSLLMVMTLLKTASLPYEFILESLILISSSVGMTQLSSRRRGVDSEGFSASLMTMSLTEFALMKS